MALFKIFRGQNGNLPEVKTDGYCYFTTDDKLFYIDYKDENGEIQRAALNAQDAETLTGATLATILNSSDIEIPTSKAVLDELDKRIVQSDWNESDETSNSYIKNRTHYEQQAEEVIILPEQSISYSTGYNAITLNAPIIPGEEYLVVVDGVEYTSVASDMGGVKADNLFSIWMNPLGSTTALIQGMPSATKTIGIKQVKPAIIKQLDQKFVPNADWNQVDESGDGYIKNRPFYDDMITTVIAEGTGTANDETVELSDWTDTMTVSSLTMGKEYTVVVNDIEYKLVPTSWYNVQEGDYKIGFNLPSSIGALQYTFVTVDERADTNVPFIICSPFPYTGYDEAEVADGEVLENVSLIIGLASSVSLPATVQILDTVNEFKQLDSKFIPNSDWSQSDENGDGYIKNRTHYDSRVETTFDKETDVHGYGAYSTNKEVYNILNREDLSGVTIEYNGNSATPVYSGTVPGENSRVYSCDSGAGIWTLRVFLDEVKYAIEVGIYDNSTESGGRVYGSFVVGELKQLDQKFIPNSDWSQNDSDGDGYIANRPFYSEESIVDVLPETTATPSDGMITGTDVIKLEAGKTYIVNWNGVEYECVGQEAMDNGIAMGVGLGDLGAAGITDTSTGEPFAFVAFYPDIITEMGAPYAWSFMVIDESTEVTASIKEHAVVVHYIDHKYIKDMYYSDTAIAEIIPEMEITFSDGVFNSPDIYNDIKAGKTYKVVWNGTEYECAGQAITGDGMSAVCLGDVGQMIGGTSTGEPFIACFFDSTSAAQIGMGTQFMALDGSSSATFKVVGETEIVHKLDNKYLDLAWLPTVLIGKTIVPTITMAAPNSSYNPDTENIPQLMEYFRNSDLYDISGYKLLITVDGVDYYCTQDANYSYGWWGNLAIGGEGADTGEPFIIVHQYGRASIIFEDDKLHTFRIADPSGEDSYNTIPNGFIATDATLSIEGAAADAKAVGDALNNRIPAATTSDNGKVLTVVDGKWQAGIISQKFDYITMIDQVNGCDYFVEMRNGNLVSRCKCDHIEVTTNPTKTMYSDGESVDLSGLVITAVRQDGAMEVIDNYTYSPDTITSSTTSINVTYVECGTTYSVSVPIIKDSLLVDFEYTANDDGTYTITGWKGTYNGSASTQMIVPDNKLIIV